MRPGLSGYQIKKMHQKHFMFLWNCIMFVLVTNLKRLFHKLRHTILFLVWTIGNNCLLKAYSNSSMHFPTHLTCPAWRSGGRRSSSPAWSRTPAGRCGTASSDRSGRRGTRPGRRGRGSRRHRTPPPGSPRSGSHPGNQPWQKSGYVCYCYIVAWTFTSIFFHWFDCVGEFYLVDSRKTHAEVLAGSLNWFISLSLSEAAVLPSSPWTHHTTES